MRPVSIAPVLALAALIALSVVGGVTGSVAAKVVAPRGATAPVTSTTLVCPDLDGASPATTTMLAAADLARSLSPPSQSTGSVTATPLAGRTSPHSTLSFVPTAVIHSRPKAAPAIALVASGSIAASLSADQVGLTSTTRYRGLLGVGCSAPATDWWFTGADGRVGFTDALIIANPAATAAEVSVSLWGQKGPVRTPTVESLRLPAKTTLRFPIASLAPDTASITVHVHASSGAVTAALIHRRFSGLLPDGADFMPATAAPARSAVVAGFAPGSGQRRLVLADPGSLAATVNVKLVTRSGSFAPSGENQIVVHPGHTRVVDLDRALANTTGAVELSSDQPIVAEGLSVTPDRPHRPDLMWLAATPALVGSAGIANGREPDGGHCLLLLSAPKGAAQVRVSTPAGRSTVIPVPAGRSVAVDITATIHPAAGQPGGGTWPFVVTALGSAPVYGVRVLQFTGAHGSLITAEPLIAFPQPIVLPAVQPDPRIATR
jgi:hypothetical protein